MELSRDTRLSLPTTIVAKVAAGFQCRISDGHFDESQNAALSKTQADRWMLPSVTIPRRLPKLIFLQKRNTALDRRLAVCKWLAA